jgi:hypothetical protein
VTPAITVSEVSFAGAAGHRPDGNFMPGEVVTCLFTASDFTYADHQADLRVDVEVTGPEGQTVLRQPNLELVKGAAPSLRPGTLRGAAALRISAAAPPGRYAVKVTVRDNLARREGVGVGPLTFLGTPPRSEGRLTLSGLRWAAGTETLAGSVVPLAFTVQGFATRKIAGRGHEIDLRAAASVLDAPGAKAAGEERVLVHRELPFAPEAYPVELLVTVPPGLAAGEHALALRVEDRIAGRTVSGRLSLQVTPGSLGIYTVHLHDAAALPRDVFLLGEQVFVRFAVAGFRTRGGRAEVSVDLAVAGPDGGVYLARKGAAKTSGVSSETVARAGRFPVQVPLILPALAPTGAYRLVLRARDELARKEVVTEHAFRLRGTAPRPLSEFKVDDLEVRDRPDLLPGKGDTFGAGRTYFVTLVLGGARLKERRRLLFSADIEASLRLRNLAGRVVEERKRLFLFQREMSYRPLRIPIAATWKVPEGLPGGLYDLEIEAVDLLEHRVSELRRRVEIVAGAPAVAVPMP